MKIKEREKEIFEGDKGRERRRYLKEIKREREKEIFERDKEREREGGI